MTEELNPFQIAQRQLDEAAELLGLDEATHQLLRWPRRELRVTIPVRMDDGGVQVFRDGVGGDATDALDGRTAKHRRRAGPERGERNAVVEPIRERDRRRSLRTFARHVD